MDFGDYIRMLILDYDERETIRKNKLLEAEKAQYSVRSQVFLLFDSSFIFI